MVGLVRGPTGIRCAPVEQDKMGGGTYVWTRPHPGVYPPPRSYPGQPSLQAPTTLLPPTVHPHAGNRSAPIP